MDAAKPASSLTSFHVRLSDRPGAGHVISGAADATEAAMLFLERWTAEDAGDEVRVLVADVFSGESHCFAIRMSDGEIEPC